MTLYLLCILSPIYRLVALAGWSGVRAAIELFYRSLEVLVREGGALAGARGAELPAAGDGNLGLGLPIYALKVGVH